MKVENMTSSRGNKIANQFLINEKLEKHHYKYLCKKYNVKFQEGIRYFRTAFQSYNSTIVIILSNGYNQNILLDNNTWDYSVTTGKYRNMFLSENKKETEKKIKEGLYKLTNLN
jgi:hypothetical protein